MDFGRGEGVVVVFCFDWWFDCYVIDCWIDDCVFGFLDGMWWWMICGLRGFCCIVRGRRYWG